MTWIFLIYNISTTDLRFVATEVANAEVLPRGQLLAQCRSAVRPALNILKRLKMFSSYVCFISRLLEHFQVTDAFFLRPLGVRAKALECVARLLLPALNSTLRVVTQTRLDNRSEVK
jgi:hypothetical protein